MAKFEANYGNFNVIGGSLNGLPIQYLPSNKKTNAWKKYNADYLEHEGLKMLRRNEKFAEYRRMQNGEYTGVALDFIREIHDDFDIFETEVGGNKNYNIPDWVRHFDFTSIIINAFRSVYEQIDDEYRVESEDENSTNEFIRLKTEMLKKNAGLVFQQELERTLLMRGFDINKEDFESEEQQQQYQQEVQQQIQAITPREIQDNASKNFKLVAIEWAQNTLTGDKKRFNLIEKDLESFVDFLISGRWFRHYRPKFDSYEIENWLPEETFFSEEVDTKYPQKGEFVGRIRYMSISTILNTFSHIMNSKMIKEITEYWGTNNNYKDYTGFTSSPLDVSKNPQKAIFPQQVITPFYNYFDVKTLEAFEDYTGVPMAEDTFLDSEGNEQTFSCPMRREEYGMSANRGRYLRTDIQLRKDSIRVTEGYWRSYKRMGLLVFENDFEQMEIRIVDDNLEKGFLDTYKIKENKKITVDEIRVLIQKEDLSDLIGTITYFPVPEVWKFVKIKGNGLGMKDDWYLDIKQLDFQIRGTDSNMFDVLLPVTGLVSQGVIPHIIDYQIAHNVHMNAVTELTMKELGVLFALDLKGIPSEFRGENTLDTLNELWQAGKDTGIIPLDYSKQNTENNPTPVFQRMDLSFADVVRYKWELARSYKLEAFSKLGISQELLGAPQSYATAEGVKQGVNGSYALMSPYIEKFNTSKTENMNFHIAFAQYCQVNGIDSTYIQRRSDSDISFINIMKEDGEIFPLRKIGVIAEVTQKDRKIVETIRNVVMNNNTIVNDLDDLITLYTNPVLSSMANEAKRIKKEASDKEQEAYASQERMNQQNNEVENARLQAKYQHELKLKEMDIQGDKDVKLIDSLGRAADRDANDASFDKISDAHKQLAKKNYDDESLSIKREDTARKTSADDNHNSIQLMNMALKAREIQLREKELATKKEIALTPKTVNII